jgi:hypothetical protein
MKSIGGMIIAKGKLKQSEKNLPQCFGHNKSDMDCQGIEPRL